MHGYIVPLHNNAGSGSDVLKADILRVVIMLNPEHI